MSLMLCPSRLIQRSLKIHVIIIAAIHVRSDG
jgi:hypothetical protein